MKIKKTIAIVTIALAANAMAQQNASAPVVQATEQPATVNAAPATSTPAAQAEQAAQPATQATAPATATAAAPATAQSETAPAAPAIVDSAATAPDSNAPGATVPAGVPAAAPAAAQSETAPAAPAIVDSAATAPDSNVVVFTPEADSTTAAHPADSTATESTATESTAAVDSTAASFKPEFVAAAATDSSAAPAATEFQAVPIDTAATKAADTTAPTAATAADSATTTPTEAPVTITEAPTSAHPMDMLHGNAYNVVNNEAAAATVNGNIAIPHKMRNLKFGYFEPIDGMGAVSFGENHTYFLAFDNSQDLGLVTLGFASDLFGISIEGAIGKSWQYENYIDHSETYKKTLGGTMLGITGSAKIGKLDIALKGQYVRPEDITYSEIPGEETDVKIWDAGGILTVSKSDNPKFAWTAKLNVNRHNSELFKKTVESHTDGIMTYITTTTTTSTDTTANVEIVPEFNFGSNVLASEKARIFIGLNTFAPIILFDKLDNLRDRENYYALYTSPNILGEVALGKYITAFGSAGYNWELYSWYDFKLADTHIQTKNIISGSTDVNLGARFQYEQAAIEMVFTKQFLKNPFGSFSDHDDIAMSIGAFIMF